MRLRLSCLAALAIAAPALADDIFGGIYAHDARIFAAPIYEGGADFEIGYRWHRLFTTGPLRGLQPYVLGSVNSAGDTDFAAAGLAWRIGGRLYARPGLALAIQDEPHRRFVGNVRVDLGSRVLFEPELAFGYRVLPRLSVEASWTHLSHAQIFSPQNPGLDNLGVRFNFALP